MEYSKVQHSFARTATFKGADPASRGVWLSIHVYCGDQENGGTIRSCRTWTDRQWYAAIDATKPELEAAIAQGMARWEGDDLQLNSYDKIGEDAYKVQRELNRAKANKRWAKDRAAPRETIPPVMPPASKPDTAGTAGSSAAGNAVAVPTAMPIPDHSRPDHSTHTPAVAGDEGAGADDGSQLPRQPTKEENTAALNKLLGKLIVSAGPVATPRWAAVAEQANVRDVHEALACIRWLVEHARGEGRVVEYASDVLPYLHLWKEHAAEQRRAAKAKLQAQPV